MVITVFSHVVNGHLILQSYKVKESPDTEWIDILLVKEKLVDHHKILVPPNPSLWSFTFSNGSRQKEFKKFSAKAIPPS